jgi:hypothetical protein
MPSSSRLDNCRSGKNVSRLLALVLALTIPAPLLLAGDDGRNNDREHGRFVDPIVGSWIVEVSPNPVGSGSFTNLGTFTEDGARHQFRRY